MYGYYGNYGMPNFFGGFFMFLIWVLIIVLIIWLVKNYSHIKHGLKDDNAINILKERYAKGEIEKEEFESKKKDLLK